MTGYLHLGRHWCFALAGACLAWAAPARAQMLQISPVMVELPPGQLTTTLMVTNKGTEATSVQLRSYQWTQGDGSDHLDPTTQLLVSPPITEIAAGEMQIFRIVLRHAPAGVEGSFRLLLDQLPTPATPGTIRVALRISIPVFAKLDMRRTEDLAWRVEIDPTGATLRARNSGTQHMRLLNPVLTQIPGAPLAVQQGQSPYILPGAERSWRIDGATRLRPGAMLHLAATTDAGPIEAAIHVPGP